MRGGHLMSAVVHTTCELVLLHLLDFDFKREMDEATGYKELVVELL